MPIWCQNFLCTLYGEIEKRKRFSNGFYGKFDEFVQSDFNGGFDNESKLKEILLFSIANSKYYREIIKEYDDDISALDLLNNFPILDKDEVRENADLIKVDSIKCFPFKTSGTTGKGLSFYKSDSAIESQWAIWFRHRARFNVFLGDLHVNFMGKPVVPSGQLTPPFWRKNAAINQILIPMQVVTERNIKAIVEYLNTIQPVFFCGYPSIISEVCRLAIKNNLSLKKEAQPKYIFTGAEPVLDEQRKMIENWTGAIVSDQYGMTEGVCNISKCPNGNYHEDIEFGYIEKLNPEELHDGSIRAEIVGTSFYNKAFPLIRYRTGDVATWEPEGFVCGCGLSTPVVRDIQGRLEDFVITPEGRRIMRFDYVFKDSSDIQEAQVIQSKLNEVDILYVPLDSEVNVSQILANIRHYISESIIVNFIPVNSIPREPNGKFRSVKNII